MKKIKQLIFLLVLLVATGYDGMAQIYCASPRASTSNGGAYTLNLTCRNVSGTTYEMKLEFANVISGINNANIYSNPGGVFIAANPVWSNGNKTLTYTFTSTGTPVLYANTLFVNMSGVGEVRWDIPTNANFAATCPSVTAPVLTTTAATGIGNTVGTMNGNISSNGGAALTSYGFYWSTTSGFANGSGTQVVKGTSDFTGNITHNLSSLAEGTPYYYKAYATNSIGTTYGTEQTFTTTSSLPAPTLGTFTVGPKQTGDADSIITPPTSNSSGTFSYSSSNTAVATIVSGNQLHIVGAGTSTITATQAASASYSSGSTTATLTVTVAGSPATAAPIPPARNTWDVISLYSGAYSSIGTWQAGTANPIGGNATQYIANMTLARLAFTPTDVSAMTHLHIDVYSATLDPTWFELQGNRVTKSTPINGWVSLDIALSEYVGLNLGSVSFFDVNNPTGAVAPADNVYVDNVYFYRPATLQPPTFSTTFTVPAKVVGDADFNLTPPTSNSPGAFSYTSSNTAVATIVNGNQIHIVGAGTSTITATQAATATYGSKSVTATFTVSFPPPSVAAPTPTVPAANVISVYSNAYSSVATALNPNWGQAGFATANVSTYTVAGNSTLYYPNFNYQGNNLNTQNLSSYVSMHLDVWSPNVNFLRISLIGTGERGVTIAVTPNSWNSIDLLLTQWSSQTSFSLANINQIKYENVTSLSNATVLTGGTLYLDNVYFSNVPTAVNPTISGFTVPTKNVGDADFTITQPSSNSPGTWSYTSSNTAVATIVNGNQIHIVGPGSSTITATQAAATGYNSGSITATFNALTAPTLGAFTVPAKSLGDAAFTLTAPTSNSAGAFTYTSSNTSVATISGNTVTIVGVGSSTITATQAANGIYNSASATASLVVTLNTAAPTPPVRNAWDVISVYSGAYTNITPTPSWSGNPTPTDATLGGDATKFLANYILGQVGFNNTNVSAMSTLHFDIFSLDYATVWVRLNNVQYIASTPVNGWRSFDIPLSTFTGAPLTAINNLQFVSPTGAVVPLKNIYVDNIYFYRAATLQPPTITNFSIPAKAAGDPAFTITPPTSDSPGAFTYTSSNTNVATISGNTITIVGGGTSTITATQAASGTFSSGTATAQFVVAYAPPTASPVPPARTPDRIVSMFTGTPAVYPNAINAVRATWTGGTTMTAIPNGTNTCLKLDNFGFLGLVNQGDVHFSAEGMTNLHLDIYLNEPLNANPALSRIFVFLLSNGDQMHEVTNLTAGWNSINIELSAYPNANLADIYGLKLEQNTSAATQIYIDNVYFSNDCYTYYTDADEDGYGDDNTGFFVCQLIPGFATVGGDCDDNNPTTHPNAPEVCYDGIDNDCDGFKSEGCAPVTTSILPSFCGSTLANAKSNIGATAATYSGPFTVSYLFRITNMTSNPQVTVDLPRAFRNFNLGMTNIIAYGSTYSVSVAAVINGEEQPFSSPCFISTPAIPTTKLIQCGGTATSMTSSVGCNAVSYALKYQFEVTLASSPGVVKEFERVYSNFNMAMVTSAPNALPLLYDTDYTVRVKAKVLIDGEEIWGNYGAPCTVRTPAAPEAFMANCGENGITPASMSTILYANAISNTTMYRFTLINEELGYNQFVEHTFNNFKLSDFNALATLTPGATYSVIVDAMLFGNYYPGKDCQIVVPGGNADGNNGGGTIVRTEIVKDEFKATAYPNPFANNFLIDVATKNNAAVNVKVYDMVGRLIDQQQFDINSVGTSPIGNNYPSGVYNVVITQGEETQTLRVVKR